MMRRAAIAFGVSLTAFALPATALAQTAKGFGETGQAILSVERLMPLLAYENAKVTTGNDSTSAGITSFALVVHDRRDTFYNAPRFAFDYVVTSHLTIGGSAYVYTQLSDSATTTTNNRSVSVDAPRETLWGIAPRIGYVIGLSDSFAFWPRGGFSFNDGTNSSEQIATTNAGGVSTTLFALDLEPTFVWVPIEHVGITASGILDIPITGSASVPNGDNPNVFTSYDLVEWQVGLHVGLLAYF